MELTFLKKFENQKVKIILKNTFIYNDIYFKVNPDGNLEFEDKNRNIVIVEPEFISMISKLNGDNQHE